VMPEVGELTYNAAVVAVVNLESQQDHKRTAVTIKKFKTNMESLFSNSTSSIIIDPGV